MTAVLVSVAAKENALLAEKLPGLKTSLPAAVGESVRKGLADWQAKGTIRKL